MASNSQPSGSFSSCFFFNRLIHHGLHNFRNPPLGFVFQLITIIDHIHWILIMFQLIVSNLSSQDWRWNQFCIVLIVWIKLYIAGSNPPPKPWERAGSSSGPGAPFKPPSGGSTSDVVEASGTAKPGEIVTSTDRNAAVNRSTLARPVPTRPWEQNYGNTTYGGGALGGGEYVWLFHCWPISRKEFLFNIIIFVICRIWVYDEL